MRQSLNGRADYRLERREIVCQQLRFHAWVPEQSDMFGCGRNRLLLALHGEVAGDLVCHVAKMLDIQCYSAASASIRREREVSSA